MYLEVRSVVVDSRLDAPCTFKVVRVVMGFQGWFGVKVSYSGCPSDFGAFLGEVQLKLMTTNCAYATKLIKN